jgi:hypothetical protein
VKLFKTVTAIIATIALLLTTAIPANAASDSIRYKTEKNQTIKKGKWTTINFNGKTAIQGNGKRSIFCYQVVINTKGKKKPKYVKVRMTRVKPGKDDSTATNTYFFTSKPGSKFVASQCWNIVTKHPVVLQVRISGGSKTYQTDITQFKMWTPGADYPADFSDFIPETTIN